MRSHPFTFTLVLLVLFLIHPAAALTFSDNFNDANIADWAISSGSVTTKTPGFDGTAYMYSDIAPTSTATNIVTHASSTGQHTSFDAFAASPNGSTVRSFTIYFQCDSTCTSYNAVKFGSSDTLSIISSGSTSFVPISYTLHTWYHFVIDMNGNNAHINITNSITHAVISDQNVVLTQAASPTNFRVSIIKTDSGAATYNEYDAGIDNIISQDLPFGGTSTNIFWENSQYTVGDSPRFSWSITDTDWNSHPLQIYVSRLYKSGIMQDWGTFNYLCLCWSQLAVAQSGSYTISADVPGTYLITLELIYPGLGLNQIVSQSTASVHAQSSSYFNIPSTAFIKTNTTATYHIGIGGRTGAIDWYFLNNGIEERESGKILTGTDGTVNITFSRVGTYNVYLKSVTGKAETFQMHTVVTSFLPSTPTNNFSTSSISLIPINGSGGSFGNYHMNEVLFGNYSIKSTVFADEGTFFLDIFNNDAQAITTTYYGSGGTSIGYNDFGTFALVISNNANDVLKTHWIPGNNSVRLRIQYPNGTLATLAMDTFSLSKLTISGYGLDVTPLQVAINQPVTATATSPESNSSLVITGANGYSKTYALPSGTTTLSTSFNQPGIYGFNLYSSFGYLAMSTQVTVSASVVTPTPSTPANTRTLDFISSGSFLALIIFVTIIGLGGALAGAVGFLVGTFASIPLLYLAGLIPLWVVFLDAGTVFLGLSIMIIHQLTKSS